MEFENAIVRATFSLVAAIVVVLTATHYLKSVPRLKKSLSSNWVRWILAGLVSLPIAIYVWTN